MIVEFTIMEGLDAHGIIKFKNVNRIMLQFYFIHASPNHSAAIDSSATDEIISKQSTQNESQFTPVAFVLKYIERDKTGG